MTILDDSMDGMLSDDDDQYKQINEAQVTYYEKAGTPLQLDTN